MDKDWDPGNLPERKIERAAGYPLGGPLPNRAEREPAPPPRSQRQRLKRSPFQRYRIIPLTLLGLVIYAVIFLLLLLLSSYISFETQLEIGASATLPLLIYLAPVFIATCLMTLLIKGGTVYPALLLSLITSAAAAILAESPSFGGIMLRLGLTLLVAVIAFTITKLLCRKPRPAAEDKMADALTFREYN